MAANMLAAYYGKNNDSRGLFSGLKIAEDETFEKHLNKYNVIHINMIDFLKALVTRLIEGESVPVNPDKFQNDMTTLESADDVLTLLVHLGYLTYDFYNQKVTIPNQEVQKGLQEWYSS